MRYHAVVILLAGVLTYATSLSGPFLLDDQPAIVKNDSIRTLSPLSVPFSPPKDTPVAGRPAVNLTFALNYAMSGLDVRSYHVMNVAIHLLAGLVLFGAVRRTLRLPTLPPALSAHADGLALATALVWTLHPLASEPVNYVSMRSEALMGLAYLLTIYCALRASVRPAGWRWRIAAVAACALGMASKESMVTAPLMVLLFDRVFLYPSFGAALRERIGLYGGLAATWLVLAGLMWSGPRAGAIGTVGTITPLTYFLDQFPMIVRYLWLSVWPRALVVDYGVPQAVTFADVWLPGALLVLLGLATLAALRLRPALGFLGLWFFVTLGPTSSVVPIATEVGAERRMYLPLVAVVILGVVGVFRLLSARRLHESRVPAVVVAVVCLLLATGTIARTREYQNGRTLAQVTVDRYPNGRARLALANEMVLAGDHQAALAELQAAVKDYPPALFGLATEMVTSGRLADAVTHAREFIRQVPDSPLVPAARDLMGRALVLQGEFEPAAEQFTLLAYARPNEPGPLASIGDVRLRQRRLQESINSYEGALRLRPGDPDILGQLGLAFAAAGRMSDASLAFGGAVTVRPTDLRLLSLLGRTLAAEGRYLDAVAPMRRVVELAPTDSQAVDNLAVMERLAARQQAAQPQAAQVARP